MIQVLSYGGGVQSVTLALLVANGKLPRPDAIIMADTGREKTSTWEYLEAHVQPVLAGIGMSVEVAPHELSSVDLLSYGGSILMPMWTTQPPSVMPEAQIELGGGLKASKLPTYCSDRWKKEVVRRYIRRTYGLTESKTVTWLGYSLDEIRRVKTDSGRRLRYPLINELPMSRSDCKRYILECGLPLPQKSACWMCPHMNDSEWAEMRRTHPQDFERAAALERELQQHDAHVWLHKSAKHIDAVVFNENAEQEDSQCGLGLCMI